MKRASLLIALSLQIIVWLAACVAPTHTVKSAFAAAEYTWSKWRLQVSFPAAAHIEAIWLVDIGHTVGDHKIIDIAYSEPVTCTTSGAVVIEPGKALFSGSTVPGWITCPIPDYAATVSRLTGGVFAVPATCTPKYAWTAADLRPTVSSSELPLVHLPNMHLSVYNPPAAPATLELRLGTTTMSSSPFAMPAPLRSWAGADSDYAPIRFMREGIPFGPTYSWSPYIMSTGPTTVFLGHNPVTGAFYSGELYWVEIDPGCQTN